MSSVLIPQYRRPGPATTSGNHEARLRALERAVGLGWRFNYDNEGGWGYLQFNDQFDLDLLPDPLAVGGNWGGVIQEASGQGLLIGSTTLVELVGTSGLTVLVGGNKIFEFRTDGSIHGPAGGNIVFDL